MTGRSSLDLYALPVAPVQWVVKGIIPEGLTVIGGRPKTGKSWLALEVAEAAANGGRVLDRKAPKLERVTYLALEDSYERLARRLQQRQRPAPEHGFRLVTMPDFRKLTLEQPKEDPILALYAAAKECDLLVVDTFEMAVPSAAQAASDGGYSQSVARWADLKWIIGDPDTANSIIVLHHHRKRAAGANGGNHKLDPIEGLLGSQAIGGTVDTAVAVERDGLIAVVSRDMPDKNIPAKFDGGLMLWGRTDDDVAAGAKPKPAQSAAKRILAEHPEWSNRKIADEAGVSEGAVRAARKSITPKWLEAI